MKLLLIAILGGGLFVNAQSRVYEEVAQLVKEQNPELRALKAENESLILEMSKDNLLENPEVEFGYLWGSNNPENKWDLSISQTFDFPILYSSRRKALKARRESVAMAYELALIDRQLAVKQMLIELVYNEKATKIQEDVVNNLAEAVDFLQRAYDNGETTILDVNKARIEHAGAIVTLTELADKKAGLLVSLLTEVGTMCDVHMFEGLEYPLDNLNDKDYYMDRIRHSSQIEVFNAENRELLLKQKIARQGNLPRITLGYVHEREGYDSFDGFKVGFTLPFFSNRVNGQIVAQQKHAVDFAMQAKLVELESSISTDYELAQRYGDVMQLLGPMFKLINHPTLLTKAFKGGQLNAMEYLNELNYFHSAELEFLAAERDYHLVVARLNRFD